MRKGHRRRMPMAAMDQINVTPLLDLTFLLLIAFMITMPPLLLEYGIDVNAPELNANELPENTDKAVNLTITKSRDIRINNMPIDRKVLPARLAEIHRRAPQTPLLVRGDGEVAYNDVVQLLDIARCAGAGDPSTDLVDKALASGAKKIQLFKPHFKLHGEGYVENTIRRAHEHGIAVNYFIAGTEEEAHRLLEMGADTIMTNDYLRIAGCTEGREKYIIR